MESSTPEMAPGDVHLMEQSILNTPKPQASSTVNRRPAESLPLIAAVGKIQPESQVSSPSFLLNAIDGMRLMASQLGSLSELSDASSRRLASGRHHNIRKAASALDLNDDRRESVLADSEANSSLGILKLDDYAGFSEAEDGRRISEVLQNIRKDSFFETFLGKDIQKSNPEISMGGQASRHEGANDDKCRAESTSTSLTQCTDYSSSHPQAADLRLRLQKVLAQRTIDRSIGSARVSLMSNSFDVDRAFAFENDEPIQGTQDNDSSGPLSHSTLTPSPLSNATFGAANFMSFSGSPAVFDSNSSETFQPADLAMDRLKQDENSWRQHFDDLPALKDTETAKSNVNEEDEMEHLTQNLDLSTMSGIIAGEVTVSSSIMEDFGKRRLSAGEYFKLHTEQLGGMSEDERPNFGHSIRSPPKRRPHPPLVNINSSIGSYIDDVPTRDSGLNKSFNSSFLDSLNCSQSVDLDATNHHSACNSDVKTASKSMELMPPPPCPKLLPKERISERDSLSTRMSVSLSLPKDSNEGSFKDLNSSALSLDSGEKFLSISQMVKIMEEVPSGTKSARELVDDLMQKCRIAVLKPEPELLEPKMNTHRGVLHDKNITSNTETKPASHTKMINMDSSVNSSTQRVKEWISSINNSGDDSVFEHDLEDADDPQKHFRRTNSCYSTDFSQATKDLDISSKMQRYSELKENFEVYQRQGGSKRHHNNQNCRDKDSVSSFMPPPAKALNSVLNRLGNFSTPKAHHQKCIAREVSDHERPQRPLKTRAKSNSPSQKSNGDTRPVGHDKSSVKSRSSLSSEDRTSKNLGSFDRTSSKHSSQSSSSTLTSSRHRTSSQKSDEVSLAHGSGSDRKYSAGVSRPPSNCGSIKSVISSTKSSSKQTDVASVISGPLHIDSTHTQLSWASVSPGSNVTQTFALRNKAPARVRLLVKSPSTTFKLVGERGEVLPELMLTLHSEETRRIHVVFSPVSIGSVVGKLVISRVATSESCSSNSDDRRLIALYGYGGKADLAVEGASKDRWAQLFLNMNSVVDTDVVSVVSDIDASHDAPQIVSSFNVRNCGKVAAFISLQIAGELPFNDCGVYVAPKDLLLAPGEVGRVLVRFDPCRDILQWLTKNADDMQLLGNLWLSWSELATWQRIRRIYLKYYKAEKTGSLAAWGSLYTGELGVGQELKDNKSSESVLAQAVRRLKVAVLIERERLNLFDLDATMVFDQLVANETAMFNSPQLDERTFDSSVFFESPILAGVPNKGIFGVSDKPAMMNDSPLSSISSQSKRNIVNQTEENAVNDLIVDTTALPSEPQTFSLEFPATTAGHKSKVKITFQNPSTNRCLVSVSDLSSPFSVSTPRFQVPSGSYVTMSVLFRPLEFGTHHSTLNVLVDGNQVRTYLLCGEGV